MLLGSLFYKAGLEALRMCTSLGGACAQIVGPPPLSRQFEFLQLLISVGASGGRKSQTLLATT